MIRQRYQLISSIDIHNQTTIKFDWTKDTPSLSLPKVIVLHATCPSYLHSKNVRYQLIPYINIVDQRSLQYDWTRSTPGHTKPKMVILDAIFPC